jgi:hypothetical protein
MTEHEGASTRGTVLMAGTSVQRGEQPPDARHPFGDGQERYFWSLLAAFGIFIAGAGRRRAPRPAYHAPRAEDVADEVDRRLTSRLSLVPHVFLDPTQAPAE